MKNFLQHNLQTIQNFCNAFRLSSFKNIWGITLNCNVLPEEIAWLNKEILDYQKLSDCCKLCTESKQPSGIVLSQLASLNPSPTFPFIAVPICSTDSICIYTNIGDFSLTDFNNDYFK